MSEANSEKWRPAKYALVLAGVYALGVYQWPFFKTCMMGNGIKELYSAVLNISAIAIGFIGTMLSILFSIGNSRVMKPHKESGAFKRLVKFMFTAMNWTLALAILTALATLTQPHLPGTYRLGLQLLWIFMLVGSCSACHTVSRIFAKMIDE